MPSFAADARLPKTMFSVEVSESVELFLFLGYETSEAALPPAIATAADGVTRRGPVGKDVMVEHGYVRVRTVEW